MRRPSSLKSQPFSQSTLHPVLQAMLGNLDVQLDEELARYRRQNGRRGGQTVVPRQSYPSPVEKTLTPTPAVAEIGAAIPAAAKAGRLHTVPAVEAAMTPPPVPSYPQAAYSAAGLGAAAVPLAIASDLDPIPPHLATLNVQPQTDDELANPSAVSAADLAADSEDAWGPDAYLESSEHLLQSLADEEVELRTSQDSGMLQSLLTPLGIGSMLLLLLSSITFGYLLMNPSSMSFLGLGANQKPSAPSLATDGEIAGTSGVPNSATGQDLSPNLSAQEFPDVNLDTLSTLPKTTTIDPASPALTDSSPSGAGSSAASISPGLDTRSAPAAPQAITSAPVSTSSAPGSRSSQTTASNSSSSSRSSRTTDRSAQRTRTRGTAVSTASARPAPSSAASSRRPAASATNGRSPSTPAASSQRVPTQPSQPRPPSPAPTVATAPRTPVVVPSPRSTAPNSTAPSTAAPVYYYVVMDFSGDRSLEQARQVVGDAFLRNFSDGAKIQFGRFVDRDRATALARDLQSQGVSARVYQP